MNKFSAQIYLNIGASLKWMEDALDEHAPDEKEFLDRVRKICVDATTRVAGLLDSIATLLEELGLPEETAEPMTFSGEAQRIWESLDIESLPLDVLATRSSLSLGEAALALVELELAGFVDRSSSGYSRGARARAL